MVLNEQQKDALSELVNIGYGRAAAALSSLINQRVSLTAPVVDVHTLDEVKTRLGEMLQGTVATVHQFFSGPVAGHALLVLEYQTAQRLTEFVVGSSIGREEERSARRDALSEIGNILLQAAIGVCGNLLQVRVAFAAPNVGLDTVDDMLSSVNVDSRELQFALLIQSRFELKQSDLSGYLVIALGVCSMSRLLEELDKWAQQVS